MKKKKLSNKEVADNLAMVFIPIVGVVVGWFVIGFFMYMFDISIGFGWKILITLIMYFISVGMFRAVIRK